MQRILLAIALTACAPSGPAPPLPPLPTLPFTADTMRAQAVRPGVTRRFIYAATGPWAIHVLDVNLGRCFSLIAVKGAPGAIGRQKTSVLLRDLTRDRDVVGGVNADFFHFTPAGVPSGTLVSSGRVIVGPSAQPVLAIDSRGKPTITTLDVSGRVKAADRTFDIGEWNRAAPRGVALFDDAWASATDTATSAIEVTVSGDPRRVILVDTLTSGVAIPTGGAVLVAGRNAPDSLRAQLRGLRAGDAVSLEIALSPMHPREAVGGRPVLVRDSVIMVNADTTAFATTRHPRTAVGISDGAKRILLVAVDGRQVGYSAGMTLRELANLMVALGARDALNLDGGGSTTLVYADPDSARALRVANRPSDAQGERAVGDALAIVNRCPR